MLQSLGLNHASTSDLMVIAFGTAIVGTVLGIVADAIMKRRGFGIVGNGVLIVIGAAAATYVVHNGVAGISVNGTVAIGLVEFAGAVASLLFFGITKALVLR